MSLSLKENIKALSSKYFQQTIDHRHYLHTFPELSFQEYTTATYVENKLKEIGFTNIKRLAKTGVVAMLHPDKKNCKVVGLRADLDALPITETNNVTYKSQNNGVMHACGHDVHTAILLTVAKILFELKEQIEANVKFIFQPGEELLPGGASVLINEGVLEEPKVDYLIAQHVTPQIEAGKIGFKKGLFMASTDEIYITVKGIGGHAAMPDTYVSPILIASAIITKLHQFFMIDKINNYQLIPTVLAFGKIEGIGATNVIPNEVNMAGTFRTLDENWRKQCHASITSIAKELAKSMGGDCDININYGYPCLVNDEIVTEKCVSTAASIIKEENIIALDYRMTAEDFAYFSQIKPVCFYRLGTGNLAKNTSNNVHTSNFDIDENVLEFAPAIMACMAMALLE
jgi:amidohydrolase